MDDFLNFFLYPVVLTIIFFVIIGNKHVIAFKKRNRTLFNVLKVIGLLFLGARAIANDKSDEYTFAIFYGFLAMYDTYIGDKEKKKEKDKKAG